MFLEDKFGFLESQDYTLLPGYNTLSDEKKRKLRETYDMAYHKALPMGLVLARGKAHEDAKIALAEALKVHPTSKEAAPLSIFAGLDNCQ